jgi:monofunctional biosynthetic peptidoglycan transglycosylase
MEISPRSYHRRFTPETAPIVRSYRWARRLLRWLAYLLLAIFTLSVLYIKLMPVSVVMLASGIRGDGMQRQSVALSNISPALIRAVIASEDGRFCNHHGIDWHEAEDAVNDALRRGKPTRGASTISMQVARNLFLGNGRYWLRKALEVPLAWWLDTLWGKRRMLEVYLNIAEWGKGIFGIEAAAQHYFQASARNLGAYESALLARTLPDPHDRNPANPGPGLTALAGSLMARLAKGADTQCVYR